MSIVQGLKYLINGEKINPIFLGLRNKARIRKLQNRQFSLVANNCVAGTIYSDLGIEYQTPFVGLYILPNDFVKLCENIKPYLSLPLVEVEDDKFDFPVAMLGDIKIFFMHYQDFRTASETWSRRLSRFSFENIFIILVQKDGCSYEDMVRFNSLGLSKKIILTSRSYPEFTSAFTLKSFRGIPEVGELLNFKGKYLGNRYMYEFDFVNWLNSL